MEGAQDGQRVNGSSGVAKKKAGTSANEQKCLYSI